MRPFINVAGCSIYEQPQQTQQAPAAPVRSATAMDPVQMQEVVARYMAEPLHKALYLNVTGKGYFASNSGKADVQDAIDTTREECQRVAPQYQNADPSRCTPIYIDEQRMVDTSIYLQ